MIENLNADKILIATGSVALIPGIEGINRTGIVSALDILAGSTSVGNWVAIVAGGLVGLETADFLVEQSKKVIIFEILDSIVLI